MDLDDEWDSFVSDPTFKQAPIIARVREHKDTPLCDPITISTKTKIIYLNISIDLFQRFWDLPMIDYDTYGEGIIKKQIKFNFVSKEELENFNEYVSREPRLKDGKGIHTLTHIDNPNGRVKFKDIKKIDIGFCKNDYS